MAARYAHQRPTRELAVHLGLAEAEPPARDGGDLLWIGRIHPHKAPHLAIRAAGSLGMPITVAGPVFDHDYLDAHRSDFTADHVTMIGEVGGPEKADVLADARALVYTCAPGYIEAGAACFGKALRAGTPVAALAWQPGTCAQAALCDRTGRVALVDPAADEYAVAAVLAEAIGQVTTLGACDVQQVGMARFDPARHFRSLATRPC